MNKQKDRFTPFKGKYRMPINQFCERYGLNLQVVLHRLNVKYWDDFDALVVPQELGDAKVNLIARAIKRIDMGWTMREICNLGFSEEQIEFIKSMSEYKKEMFRSMLQVNTLHLDPDKIDLDKIFTEVDGWEVRN